jgi:hypothetical protein
MGISNLTKFSSAQYIKLTTFVRAYDLKKQNNNNNNISKNLAKNLMLKPLQYFTKQLTLSKKKKKKKPMELPSSQNFTCSKRKRKITIESMVVNWEKMREVIPKLLKLVVQASP